jgi:hypothetical protein
MPHWVSDKFLAMVDSIQALFVSGDALRFDFAIFLAGFFLIVAIFLYVNKWRRRGNEAQRGRRPK